MILLETSSHRSCLLLAAEGQILAELPLEGGPLLSRYLGEKIQEQLTAHPAFRAEFIAVGIGPGSYTGIRVGVAMAKALAFGWKIPLLGFCSLQAFAPREPGSFAILADAGLGGVYCLKGERTDSCISFEEPCFLPISQVVESLADFRLLSPHPPSILKRLAINLLEISLNPHFLIELCYSQKSQSISSLDPFPLIYLASLDEKLKTR